MTVNYIRHAKDKKGKCEHDENHGRDKKRYQRIYEKKLIEEHARYGIDK